LKKSILFVQGTGDMWAPDGSGVLVKHLERELGPGYVIVAPEMPGAATDPHYAPWRDEIDRQLGAIDGPIALIGHSFGASVLLKYLVEGSAPGQLRGLFLLSTPWWPPEGWSAEYALPADFGSRLPRVPTFLYHIRSDPDVPYAHLAVYERHIRWATSRSIDGAGHSFSNGLPELVADLGALAWTAMG